MTAQVSAANSHQNAYLLFRFRGELFGNRTEKIREVIPYQQPRNVPNTRDHFRGIINLRGEVAGVFDIGFHLSLLNSAEHDRTPKVYIVFSSTAGLMAVGVDGIEGIYHCEGEILSLEDEEGNEATEFSTLRRARFPRGVATLVDLADLLECTEVSLTSGQIVERRRAQ